MGIDPMTKMWIAIAAMVLMFVCNIMVVYSRKLQSGAIRFLLKSVAYLLLLITLLMILLVIF